MIKENDSTAYSKNFHFQGEREFSIGQSQSESFANEDAIRTICTHNYPRSSIII
jgi:hypothetical protein